MSRYTSVSLSDEDDGSSYRPTFRIDLKRRYKWLPRLVISLAAWSLIGLGSIFTILAQKQQMLPSTCSARTFFNDTSPRMAFIKTAASVDIAGHDYRAMKQLCEQTMQREGLVFSHMSGMQAGGIGNIRNEFTNGLRFAIEAGATGYILGDILARDPCDVADFVGSHRQVRDFTYLFDRQYFKSAMAATCPSITIYDDLNTFRASVSHLQVETVQLSPKDIMETGPDGWAVAHPEDFRSTLEAHLTTVGKNDLSSERLLQVILPETLMQWPIMYDTPAIVSTFSHPLRPHGKVLELAATVLYSLKTRFSLTVNASHGIQPEAYYGAHLRTSKDAAHWLGYEGQRDAIFGSAKEKGLKVIYIATGDQDHLAQIKAEALEQDLVVVDKNDLLSGEDLEALLQMSWDQQAIVDYEMMLKSSWFSGIGASSFAYNIAVKRHSTLLPRDPDATWRVEQTRPDLRPWWSNLDALQRQKGQPTDGLSALVMDTPDESTFNMGIWA